MTMTKEYIKFMEKEIPVVKKAHPNYTDVQVRSLASKNWGRKKYGTSVGTPKTKHLNHTPICIVEWCY